MPPAMNFRRPIEGLAAASAGVQQAQLENIVIASSLGHRAS